MTFAISTATIDITPSTELPMGGYGTTPSPRLSTGTRTALSARCIILWDNGCPNAIISLDLLGLTKTLHQNIRVQLVPLSTWLPENIIIITTHTHNGPALPTITYNMTDTTDVDNYAATLVTQIVTCVQTALSATQTACTLDYSTTTQNWSSNREGLSHVETIVPVLVARSLTGAPRAVLFSYGCHPVSAGSQTLWDGDYPAGARATIESALPDCMAMFMLGPAGDQDPVGNQSWSLRDALGTQLGKAVVAVAKVPGRTLGGPINASLAYVKLPLDIVDTPTNLAAMRACYEARVNNLALPALPMWYKRHAADMITAIDAHDFALTVSLPVQVWRIPDTPTLQICVTGGELVSEYAVHFRSKFGETNELIIGGYANECPAYIPNDKLLPPVRVGGSYAGGWATDYPSIAGESMAIYPHVGHFKSGVDGVEDTLINAITTLLS